MAAHKEREPFQPSNLTMTLDDVSLNLPAVTPITRSFSKSTTRDLNVKYPPPPRAQVIDRAEDDISVQPSAQADNFETPYAEEPPILPADHTKEPSCSPIEGLPTEILDAIIGHVGGQLGPAALSGRSERARNWNAALRHPRRKTISDLALVAPDWRKLVQERIFRHIKIRGTQNDLANLGMFFLTRAHLKSYVRHLQIIVPIWETKKGASLAHKHIPDVGNMDIMGSVFLANTINYRGVLNEQQSDVNQIFKPASTNATLSDIFATAEILFSELYAMTIETGHCKRPPQIKFFSNAGCPQNLGTVIPTCPACPSGHPPYLSNQNFQPSTPPGPHLRALCSLRVLILKGAWNVIRQPSELHTIHAALPNILELHATYHTPKTDAYTTMTASLSPRVFPSTIRHLNICLEGLYTPKTLSSLQKWRKVYPTHHICRAIGSIAPQLESLTYSGRLCGSLFSTAVKEAEKLRSGAAKLKRVDLVVQNICRDAHATNDGTGIHNWPFIQGFEMLVLQAMRALAVYTDISFLRIRFIDLDAPDPLLNPSFHLEGDRVWGFWSEEIFKLLGKARPGVRFLGREGSYIGEPQMLLEEGRKRFGVDFYRGLCQGFV